MDRRPPRSGRREGRLRGGSLASRHVLRWLAVSTPAVLIGLGTAVGAAAEPPPPSTEPTAADPGDSPEFERKLAELAFALYLGNELDVEAGSYSCTEPPALEPGETITCFTLTDSDRVVVVRTELTDTSGIYEFELVSDHAISPADTAPTTTTTTTTPGTTTTLPTPVLITTPTPLSVADAAVLAFGASVNQDSEAFVGNLVGGDETLVESADYHWDPATATVVLSVTLDPTLAQSTDLAAWVIARDRAAALWGPDTPFRAEGATIEPGLDVIVNGVAYRSDFDLSVQLAEETIAMADWLAASRTG
jgi:hypothetical protein